MKKINFLLRKSITLKIILSLLLLTVLLLSLYRPDAEPSAEMKRVDKFSALLNDGIYYTETQQENSISADTEEKYYTASVDILLELARIGAASKSAGPIIEKLLFDKDWEMRIKAAKTLGYIGYTETAPALIQLLEEEYDWRLVYASIKSLGRIGYGLAIPKLEYLRENHWYIPVRTMAANAIEAIQGRDTNFERENRFPDSFKYEFMNNLPLGRDLINCDPEEFTISDEITSLKIYAKSSPDEIKAFKYNLPYYEDYDYDEETDESIPKRNIKYEEVTPQVVLKVDNGWVAGANRGEWGGELTYIAEDGTSEEIFDGNVQNIYHTEIGTVAITGLSHLGLINYGNIQLLTMNEEGKWKAKRIMALPGAPWASWQLDNGDLLISTSYGSLIFTSEGNFKTATCPISVKQCNIKIDELRWVETADARKDVGDALKKNDKRFMGDFDLGHLAIRRLSKIEAQKAIDEGNYKVIDETSDATCSNLHGDLQWKAVNYASSYNEWLLLEDK